MGMDPRNEEAHREPQKPTAADDDADAKFPLGQVTTLGEKYGLLRYRRDGADFGSIAICKFSEPIAFNSVIAYTFHMSKWLHDNDGTNGEPQRENIYDRSLRSGQPPSTPDSSSLPTPLARS